jgi:hypothetical protein
MYGVGSISATVYQQNHEYPWSGYRLLDRGLLLDLAFRTSPAVNTPLLSITHQINTYHLRFIPEGVAEISQIFHKTPKFYQNYLAMSNADVTGGKPIAI